MPQELNTRGCLRGLLSCVVRGTITALPLTVFIGVLIKTNSEKMAQLSLLGVLLATVAGRLLLDVVNVGCRWFQKTSNSNRRCAAFVTIAVMGTISLAVLIRISEFDDVPVGFILAPWALGLIILAGITGTASLNKRA